MALNKATGVISCPGSTGTDSVAGLGFQPDLVIFWSDNTTSTGNGDGLSFSFGAMDGSGNQFSTSGSSKDAQVTSDASRIISNTQAVTIIDDTGEVVAAVFDSMDAGGFTLDFTTVSSGVRIYWTAIGGLTNAQVGTFALRTSTGSQTVSGIGFQPTALILNTAFYTGTDSIQDGLFYSFGFASGADNEFATSMTVEHGANPTDTYRTTSNADILIGSNAAGSALVNANFTGFNSDGWTINYTTATAAAHLCGYIAISGADAFVGNDTTNTSTGTNATTGVGFLPEMLFLLSDNGTTTDASINSVASVCFGSAIGTNAADHGVVAAIDRDNVSPTDSYTYNNTSYIHSNYTAGGLVDQSDVDSFDSDGFTLNCNVASGTGRVFGFLALAAGGGTTAAPTTSGPTTPAPTSLAPTTSPPTTLPPTTVAPTTAAPTTAKPTTPAPTSLAPTTQGPTTVPPTTPSPTTIAPTTTGPTTAAPTTPSPTTPIPTSLAPTTLGPTTMAPSTLPPTTLPPTTLGPTTLPPPTTAPPAPVVRRRGIKDFGFSFRDRWR